MTAIPEAVAERVGKILGRLGSSHDGEVVAARNALMKTLAGAGLGIVDLAEHITRPPETRVVYRDRPAPQQGPRDFDYGGWRQSRSGFDPHRCNRARAAKLRAASPGFLSDWEASFLASLARQMDQGRELSPKQQGILREIHSRYEARFG
jgi:hypothetical protein